MAPTGTSIDAPDDTDAQAAADAFEASVKDSSAIKGLLAIHTRRLFRQHGLTSVVQDSQQGVMESLDLDAIRSRVLEEVDKYGIVVDKATRDSALHRDQITGAVLHEVPTPSSDAWDALPASTRDAWKQANVQIWKSFNMASNGPLQRQVAEREDGTMLVKTKTQVYLTNVEKYIREDAILPELDKLERLGTDLGEKFALWARQVPALKAPAKRLLTASLKETRVKAEAAYTYRAPSDNDDE